MDGSWHDWFEGRSGWCCLMVMVDDATGRTFARFYERETQQAAFDVFGRYAAAHGLPRSLYVDRAGTPSQHIDLCAGPLRKCFAKLDADQQDKLKSLLAALKERDDRPSLPLT